MNDYCRDAGSFRDPAGYILTDQQSIYRIVTEAGLPDYLAVRKTPIIEKLIAQSWLVDEDELSATHAHTVSANAAKVLKHSKLPFISYPYEWTFSALKQAALRHLAIQQYALAHDVSLVDASAYNMQFLGAEPIFIDHLSFRAYQTGEFWLAHQQFCNEFLNPLLLKSHCNVDFQAWYRGTNAGILTKDIAKLLPWHKKLRLSMLLNVVLPARFEKQSKQQAVEKVRQKKFHKTAYFNMLRMLENTIKKLTLSEKQATHWQNYAEDNHYQLKETQAKLCFIRRFIEQTKPKQLWDLGCNRGDYAIEALKAGVEFVVGMDTDLGALEHAYHRAKAGNYQFLPLYMDCTNPTSSQGWAGIERQSLSARSAADALIALALIHHLALGHNVSLSAILDYMLSLAPMGVLEFVPKNDPMVKLMLGIKGDLFPDYNYDNFISLLAARANIIQVEKITEYGRTLVWFEKK